MNKKAQGLPMDVIIIAILVILVLVIVSVIVMVRMGLFVTGTSDCEKQAGGSYLCSTDAGCRMTSDGDPLEGYSGTSQFSCKKLEDQPRYCCFKIGAQQ